MGQSPPAHNVSWNLVNKTWIIRSLSTSRRGSWGPRAGSPSGLWVVPCLGSLPLWCRCSSVASSSRGTRKIEGLTEQTHEEELVREGLRRADQVIQVTGLP